MIYYIWVFYVYEIYVIELEILCDKISLWNMCVISSTKVGYQILVTPFGYVISTKVKGSYSDRYVDA